MKKRLRRFICIGLMIGGGMGLFSCRQAQVLVLFDETFLDTVDRFVPVYRPLKKVFRQAGISVAFKRYPLTQESLDFSSVLAENAHSVVVLSPLLQSRLTQIQPLFPDRLFVVVGAALDATTDNSLFLKKDRGESFRAMADEVFDYQKAGYKIGTVFYLGTENRISEKNSFYRRLYELNHQNYPTVDVPLYQTDSRQTAETAATLEREGVDLLLLFAASQNQAVLEAIGEETSMQVITEMLTPADRLWQKRVVYSLVPDAESAFREALPPVQTFLTEGHLPPTTVSLPARKEYLKGVFPPPPAAETAAETTPAETPPAASEPASPAAETPPAAE